MKYLSNQVGAFIWREGNTDDDKWIRPISPLPTSLQNHRLATAAPFEHHGCMLTEFQIDVSDIKLPGTFSGSTPRLALGRLRVDHSPAHRADSEARGLLFKFTSASRICFRGKGSRGCLAVPWLMLFSSLVTSCLERSFVSGGNSMNQRQCPSPYSGRESLALQHLLLLRM